MRLSDDDHHPIEVPMMAGRRAGVAPIGGNEGCKFQKPAADRLIENVKASHGERLLRISKNTK